MSYNSIDWLERHSINSVDRSRDSQPRDSMISLDSALRPSTDSSGNMAIINDALHIRVSQLDQLNAKIKHQILKFGQLSDQDRKGIRMKMQEAMSLADDITKGVKK